MKVTIGSKALLEKLQFVGAVIPATSTLPILNNFLFDFDENALKITGSDLETTIHTEIEIENTELRTIAVPAKMLLEILKAFPDQPLTFEILENSTIELSSSVGKYAIAYEDGATFPLPEALADGASVSMPARVLAAAIGKTLFATSTDDLRPVMMGVLFEMGPSGTNFVATDAHKLARYSRSDVQSTEPALFVVPRKPLAALKSILAGVESNVEILYSGSNAVFQFGTYVLSCRLIDAKFPNYETVIPKENPNVLTIDRNQLLGSVKCVSIFSNKLTHQVRLDIKGSELKVSAEDIDYSNKANERLSCNYEGSDLTIGFNSRFLIEMLGILQSEQIQLEMSQPNRAGILSPIDAFAEGESVTMLVMPVLIKE